MQKNRRMTIALAVGMAALLGLGVWLALAPGIARTQNLAEQQRLLELREEMTPAKEVEPLPSAPIATPSPAPLPFTGEGVLFYDCLEMQLPLTDGVSVEQLKTAVGHVPETAPIGGEGNAVVAGHRSYTYGDFFNRLGEAEVGDLIHYEDVSGAVFVYEVYQLLEIEPEDQTAFIQPKGEQLLTLYTDSAGAGTLTLPLGSYYLLETAAAPGYLLPSERFPFQITAAGELVTLFVQNQKTPIPDPAPEEKPGKLLITKAAAKTDQRLKGAVFGVYEALTDYKLEELTTDRYGEATLSLAAGDYYLREQKAPSGYELDASRIPFRIRSEKVEAVTVTNKAVVAETTPPTAPEKPAPPSNPSGSGSKPTTPAAAGGLSLRTKAEGSGKPLSGAVFAVYNAQNNEKIGEITTSTAGKASMRLSDGRYYLLEKAAPQGYLQETAKILFTIKSDSKTLVEVTKMRDRNTMPEISIPQTGELFPMGSLVAAIVCFVLAAGMGGLLVWRRKRPACE